VQNSLGPLKFGSQDRQAGEQDQPTRTRVRDSNDACDEHRGTHHTHRDAIGQIEAWLPAQARSEQLVPVFVRRLIPGSPGLLLDRQLVTCPLATTSVGTAGTRRPGSREMA